LNEQKEAKISSSYAECDVRDLNWLPLPHHMPEGYPLCQLGKNWGLFGN
jgi:hypothetical protein